MAEAICDYWIVVMLESPNIWRDVNRTILEEHIRDHRIIHQVQSKLGIPSLRNFGFSWAYKYIQG